MRALLIPANQNEEVVEVDVPLNAEQMAARIQAETIERVVVGDLLSRARFPFVMVVDEMGTYTDKPVNPRASLLYGYPIHGGAIIGDALIVGEGMTAEGPDFTDLPDHVTVDALTAYFTDFRITDNTEALMGT